MSFRRLCDLSLETPTPDETTLCRFRNDLKAVGLGEALFAEVGRQLDAAGFLVKSGTLIDATLVASAARTPPSGSTPKGVASAAPGIRRPIGPATARRGGCSSAIRRTLVWTRARG